MHQECKSYYLYAVTNRNKKDPSPISYRKRILYYHLQNYLITLTAITLSTPLSAVSIPSVPPVTSRTV